MTKTDSNQSDWIPKFAQKIQLGTNQSPRDHRLGLTQTPGKSDRSHKRKWRKTKNTLEQKSQTSDESLRTKGEFEPPFPHKSRVHKLRLHEHEMTHLRTSEAKPRHRVL